MKKALRTFLFSLLLTLLPAFPAVAASAPEPGQGEQRVFDYAGLFSPENAQALEEKIAELKAAWPMDFVVLTIADAEGKISQAYADDFYDENGFGAGEAYSGLLVLIDMDNREMTISTCGEMIYYLTDERIESGLDISYPYLTEGDYANAAYTYLGAAEHYLEAGVPSNQYTYDQDTGRIVRRKSLTPGEIGVSLLIAAAAALIKRRATVGRYKLKGTTYAYNAHANSQIALVNENDLYLRSSETRTRVNTGSGGLGGSGGGGRSTVHRSSGGRMHGGGGRRF